MKQQCPVCKKKIHPSYINHHMRTKHGEQSASKPSESAFSEECNSLIKKRDILNNHLLRINKALDALEGL